MAVGCVDDDCIGSGLYQCTSTLQRVGSHAHTGGHAQAALIVLAGHRLVLGLGDVLIGDKSHEVVVLVHYRELLYLVLLQYLGCGSQVGLLMRGHEVVLRHNLVYLLVELLLEAQVAVGDDTHQVVLVVNDWYAANVVVAHHVERILHSAAAAYGDGVVDHSVLGTLHYSHLAGLCLDRHILVDNADATLASYRNGHRRLCHGVHCSRNERNVQVYVARELGFQLYRLG